MIGILDLISSDIRVDDRNGGRLYGVATALVDDLRDPQGLGRIKVSFPWLAEGGEATVHIDDKDRRAHSFWARMATLMGGAERGSWFIPERNDEVLVAFEHGQLDRPVVIGMLWNREDKPPEQMDSDSKNNIRAIHSRSGIMIRFDDDKDNPSLLIADKKDKSGQASIHIDFKNGHIAIKAKGDLTIDVDGKFAVTAKKEINMQTDADVTVKAKGGGTLETNSALNVKSNAKVSVDGTGQAELKATAVSVNGSGITEVKGGLVKIN
jgi:uncharacterized protein involved in type VI secretion and phage assembly